MSPEAEEKARAERWKLVQKKIAKGESAKFALYVRTGRTVLSGDEKATIENQLSKEINPDAFALRQAYNALKRSAQS